MIAFEVGCLPHRRTMLTYAAKLCRDPDVAEDVVQEAYLKAFEQWGNFHAEADVERAAKSWLYQIVHNTYLDYYRRRTQRGHLREVHRQDVLLRVYNVEKDHAEQRPEDDCLVQDRVKEALGTLSDAQRHVVEQVDLLGRKYSQVARELGIPPMTVTSRLHAARRKLESLLGGVARMNYSIDVPTPDFSKDRPSKRRSARSRVSAAAGGRRARKHADALQSPKAPQTDAAGVDGVVLGLDE